MLLSAVSVLVVAQSSSEILEGLMNNPVYFCSKTNRMHNISNLFYFGTALSMFRTVTPSIIMSLRLYIQHQVYVILVLCLLAGPRWNHLGPASKQPQNQYDIYLMLYVQS